MFKNIIRWLYLKFVSPDLSDLTSEMLGFSRSTIDLSLMDDIARRTFLSKCVDIYESQVFRDVIDDLTESYKNSTMKNAESESQFLCGKMSIYGVNSVLKEFQKYSKLASSDNIEKVDRFDPI